MILCSSAFAVSCYTKLFETFARARNHGKNFQKPSQTSISRIFHYSVCERQRFLELGTRFLTMQLSAGVSRLILFCLTSNELIRTQRAPEWQFELQCFRMQGSFTPVCVLFSQFDGSKILLQFAQKTFGFYKLLFKSQLQKVAMARSVYPENSKKSPIENSASKGLTQF